MVIKWQLPNEENAPTPERRKPAAQYVRMSTEHQQYSTDNQAIAIARYAEERGYEIVRSYADEGKSGLNLGGRIALQQLLDDIENKRADFEAVLVYDVSRWGRFQDPDEAASYELRCRRAGVAFHYCAEQFENDGSIGSSIIKTVKRAMAGEYSRELSVKVFAGQAHLIRLGFRQGGAAGFGLRRQLIDHQGEVKATLLRGEQKSIATDRIILVPGPDEEVAIVREVFDQFVTRGKTEREIAAMLNARHVATDFDRPWSRGTIHQLLINEKYIGNNVWAKTSFKLKMEHTLNDPEAWIRADGVFAGLVDTGLFAQAAAIIAARSARLDDAAMLEKLAAILSARGQLSGLIIDEADACPSSSAYRTRFGSLLRAYALVGFTPNRDYRFLEINRHLRGLYPSLMAQIIGGIEGVGGSVVQNADTDLLTINDEFTLSVVIVRCFHTPAGSRRWKLRLDTALAPSITLALRMDENNEAVRDFYILPMLDMDEAVLRLCECNGLSFDAYRAESLDRFYALTARAPVRLAA